MNAISSATTAASNATPGSVQADASISVLKKALNVQAGGVATLLAALPQPALATSGNVGTQVNTYA